jgi:hypothetical protein
MAKADPETQLQIGAVNLLTYALPRDAVFHHSHNEGKRSRREGGIAKAMGQRAGFADLVIFWNGVVYLIEFKDVKKYQSRVQREFEADMAATGFPFYAVIRSIDELVDCLKSWGIPLRAIGNARHGRSQIA